MPNFGKEEEEKRAKDKGMQLLSLYDYSIHFMNEGLMLIGGGYNSLFILFAMMLDMLIQQ